MHAHQHTQIGTPITNDVFFLIPPAAPNQRELSQFMKKSCNLRGDQYRYMEDLLDLESHWGPTLNLGLLSPHLSHISTPVNTTEWQSRLTAYLDHRLAEYLLQEFSRGFRVGFNQCTPLRSTQRNMHSARQNPSIIDNYIQSERSEERIVGPVHASTSTAVHSSPIGVIPKKHSANRWCLIVDLSSPLGQSRILRDHCSLQYMGIDEAIAMVQRHGQGCLLVKLDLKAAYRSIPVTQRTATCWGYPGGRKFSWKHLYHWPEVGSQDILGSSWHPTLDHGSAGSSGCHSLLGWFPVCGASRHRQLQRCPLHSHWHQP